MAERALLYEVEQLEKILSKNNCVLCGAGKVAKVIVNYASKKGYEIDKVLVTNMSGNPSDIIGIPVIAIEEYQEDLNNKCLIISTMENIHEELADEVSGLNFEKKYFVSDELYRKIIYHIGNYELECLDKVAELEEKIESQEKAFLRFVPKPCLDYVILNILDHCNLKCKGCDHFACIADPYFVSYETIHADLNRLSEIFHGDYIMQIGVMGGEPLLHPDLLKILKDVRDHFPYTIIRLTTNGLLLLKQKDDFWRVCRENNVVIVNTKYPINLKYDKIRERAESEGVKFQYFEGTGDHVIKKSFKKRINLNGTGNPVENFANCYAANQKNFLMEGKLYGCPFVCQSYRIFNNKFQQNLRMTESDFLDIYKVKDMQEIFDFAARPKFYCRYCSGVSPLFEWTRSKKEIWEWVDK